MDITKKKSPLKKSAEDDELTELAKNSPSLKKLRSLKEKMLKELEEQEKQRYGEGHATPMSLIGEYPGRRDGLKGKPRSPSMERRGSNDLLNKSKDPKLTSVSRGTLNQSRRDVPLDTSSRERDKLEAENQRLREMITLRQDCALRREQCCQDEIAELKRRLDATVVKTYDEGSLMEQLRGVNRRIQDEAGQLKGIIESQAEVEKMNLIRAFRVKMHELKKALAEEKQANYTGAQEWIEKNKILQNDLDVATQDLNRLKERNRALGSENKDLKTAFQNQERERTQMVKQITLVKKENERLFSQIQHLEEQSIELVKKQNEGDSPSGMTRRARQRLAQSARSPMPGESNDLTTSGKRPATGPVGGVQNPESEKAYVEAISKLRGVLESERKTLKQARSQHMALLAERTELEIFLRQCVDDVRKEIARNSKSLRQRPSSEGITREADIALDQYTASDRKRILDILMSKERVLALLYEKAFPFKQEAMQREREMEQLDTSDLQLSMEPTGDMDMNHLWSKWKNWTSFHAVA